MSLARSVVHIVLLSFVTIFASSPGVVAQAADAVTGVLKHAGISERLGETIDLDTRFLDEDGRPVRIGDYFDGQHPVVLTFAYHECPMLCPMVLDGLAQAMKGIEWRVGDEYRAVTVSISPTETPEQALRAKKRLIGVLGDSGTGGGWSFLTGSEGDIDSLSSSAGFEFEKDPETGEYGHAAAVILVSPQGVVTRYLYGISYKPFDLRAGLIEASEGRVGGIADRLILYCFHYDPVQGSYVAGAWLTMRLAGGLTLILLTGLLFVFWRREWTGKPAEAESGSANQEEPNE